MGDGNDAFPTYPTETTYTDSDGTGDNGDAFPTDPTETTDTDADGVGDNGDAFPTDPTESADTVLGTPEGLIVVYLEGEPFEFEDEGDTVLRAESGFNLLQLSNEAAEDAQRGLQTVEETIKGIESIRQTVDRASEAIMDLGNQSSTIGKILTVIDEVADQTSLLALNAA